MSGAKSTTATVTKGYFKNAKGKKATVKKERPTMSECELMLKIPAGLRCMASGQLRRR